MSDSMEGAALSAPWRDAVLIVLLAPALIAGCYSAGFLEFDDRVHYSHEQADLNYPLRDIFKAPFGTYFPMTVLSYRFDRWLFESNPPVPYRRSTAAPGVRVHSLLLHILAGIFLWRAFLLLKLGRWMSLFAATAWTVHPAACESVCWISERKNVLAAFFGFASLWAYFGGVRRLWPRVAATAALFVLGMWSKPNVAGFLPIYVLYDLLVFMQNRANAAASSARAIDLLLKVLPRVALYVFCAAVIVILARINIAHCESSTVTRAGGSLWTVFLTDVPILAEYLYNALIPTSLSFFYYSPIVTHLGSGLFLSRLAILLAAVAGTVWISANRWRTVFLWGWFFGALGPSLNIIPIPYLMQDRYAYFSLPAILVIAAETLVRVYTLAVRRRNGARPTDFGAIAAIGGSVCFAAMAFFRSGVYVNDSELLGDAIVKQPHSAYAQLHYALTLASVADLTEYAGAADAATLRTTRELAYEHFKLCLQCPDFDRMLDPGRVRILVAALDERLGRPAEAYSQLIAELNRQQLPYNRLVAFQSLARIELSRGRADMALKWTDEGLKALGDPEPSPEMLYLKGQCLERLNRIPEARAIYAAIPKGTFAYDRAQSRLKAVAP